MPLQFLSFDALFLLVLLVPNVSVSVGFLGNRKTPAQYKTADYFDLGNVIVNTKQYPARFKDISHFCLITILFSAAFSLNALSLGRAVLNVCWSHQIPGLLALGSLSIFAGSIYSERISRALPNRLAERVFGASFLLAPFTLLIIIALTTLLDSTSLLTWFAIIGLLILYSLSYGVMVGQLILSAKDFRMAASLSLVGLGIGALCHLTLFSFTDLWGQALLGLTVQVFLGSCLSDVLPKRLALGFAAVLCLHIAMEYQNLDVGKNLNFSNSQSRVILGPHSTLRVKTRSESDPILHVTKDRFYELTFRSTLAASYNLSELHALPFLLTHISDVLMLGLSGTNSLAEVIAATPRSVHLVEPDGQLLELSTEINLQEKIDPLRLIRTYNESFRRHLSRSRRFFDIIYSSRIPSPEVALSAAQAFSFDDFQTVEGWRLALKRLRSGGMLVAPGWHSSKNQRQLTKLIVLAYNALVRSGVEQPRQHLVVARQDAPKHRVSEFLLLVSKEPLSAEQLFSLESLSAELELEVLLSPLSESNLDLVWLTSPQTHASALAQVRYNAEASTDMRPFPHLHHRARQVFWDFSQNRSLENPFDNLILSTLLLFVFLVAVRLRLGSIPIPSASQIAGENLRHLAQSIALGLVLVGIIGMLLPLCPQEILSTPTAAGLLLVSIGIGFQFSATGRPARIARFIKHLFAVSTVYGLASILLLILRYTQGFNSLTILLLVVFSLLAIGIAIGAMLVTFDIDPGDLEGEARLLWLGSSGVGKIVGTLLAFLILLSAGSWFCFCLGLTLLVARALPLGGVRNFV